ncbi:hypothetical protein ACTHOQ_11910 [Solibacillus silvestris]
MEYPSAVMELTTLDEFLDEDWGAPEELREMVINFLKNGVIYPK